MISMVTVLAVSMLVVQSDTVRLTPLQFLDQARAAAPGVELATLQADAARSRAEQARAWANPQLSLQVDNYGAEREVTNIDGLAGLEARRCLHSRSRSEGIGVRACAWEPRGLEGPRPRFSSRVVMHQCAP